MKPVDAVDGSWGKEGRDEAEEGGFGEVEVGDEVVDAAEGGGWVDEDIGFGLKRMVGQAGDIGIIVEAEEGVFDGAHAGGSDGEAGAAGGIFEGGEAIGGDGVPLVVDGVLADVIDLDGVKGSDTDLEGEVVKGGAVLLELANEFGGKVESGGGCGDGLLFGIVGVNGLVAVVVAGLARIVGAALDIGRKGHATDALGEFGDGFASGGLKADAVVAVIAGFEDLGGELSGLFKVTGGEGFFAGFKETPPCLRIFGGMEEEAFDFSSGGALAVEAGFEDSGVVAEATGVWREVFA